MKKSALFVMMGVVTFASCAFAAPGVRITADVPDGLMAQRFAAGDVISVTFYVASDSDVGVFGAELDIRTKGRGARIHAVTVDPAFAGVHETQRTKLPARQVTIARSQTLENLDRTLGAGGSAVPFATVEIEMLSDLPFADALDVTARAALVGQLPETVTVLGTRMTNGSAIANGRAIASGSANANARGKAKGRLAIYSGRPVPAEGAASDEAIDQPVAWTQRTARISLGAYAPNSPNPATQLIVGQTYELYYDAGAVSPDGYLLLAADDNGTTQTLAMQAPTAGPWSNTGTFAADTAPSAPSAGGAAPFAAGLPTGTRVESIVTDVRNIDSTNGKAAVLAKFTPTQLGTVTFILAAWDLDVPNLEATDMEATLTLPVVGR